MKRTPVNIVAGPLGVGKTTAINHLLAQKPPNERWAVLVNEYGLVGLDAALVRDGEDDSDVAVREVAGGCICCSAGLMFEVSLVLLLQTRPDRLLIEPTGLAAVSGILETLARPGLAEAVEIRAVVGLLDPANLARDLDKETVRDMVAASDVLVATRADLAVDADLEDFDRWTSSLLGPARRALSVSRGMLPVEILDHERAGTSIGSPHPHEHETHEPAGQITCDAERPLVRRSHRSAEAATLGWVWWKEWTLDSDRALRWLRQLSMAPGVLRTKAVFRTEAGWRTLNAARGTLETQGCEPRADGRLELVLDPSAQLDADLLEQRLSSFVLDGRRPSLSV